MALQETFTTPQNSACTEHPALHMRYRFFWACFEDKTIFDASQCSWGANLTSVNGAKVCAYNADPLAAMKQDSQSSCVDFTSTPTSADLYINLANPTPEEIKSTASEYDRALIACVPGDAPAFEALLAESFPGKAMQLFSQCSDWPYTCTSGLEADAECWIAAVGDLPQVSWPSVGISIPTIDNAEDTVFAVQKFIEQYPGELKFAIVGNGSSDVAWARLQQAAANWGARATLIRLEKNMGYGLGCNQGLHILHEAGECEFYAVMNDDVVPAECCLIEMVQAMRNLDGLGYKPGVIAPYSDNINGCQQVQLPIRSLTTLDADTEGFRREKHSSGRQEIQLRGLFLLIHPDCLEKVGGFDPRFGIGNFEDDDHNLRTRLSGFTLWIAEGAYLHHKGSKTFKNLGIDYAANIQRNGETFGEKWQITHLEEWPGLEAYPDDVSLHVPLDFDYSDRHITKINGEMIDLVHEAGEIEFAAWVMNAMRAHPRAKRREIIDHILALSKDCTA